MTKRSLYIVGIVLLMGVALGVTVLVEPTLVAAACPSCFGFDRIGPRLYVERNATEQQRTDIAEVMRQAEARVQAFYGPPLGTPRLLVCTTATCYARVGGGGSRGMAILDRALFLSPRGLTAVIAAHELSHIELHHRIGWHKTWARDIPQWFDEGVAAIVSNDPRYPVPAPDADVNADPRCAEAAVGDLPTERPAWIEDPHHDQLYAKAALRVGCWAAQRGGPKAITDLISHVADGLPFADAYR